MIARKFVELECAAVRTVLASLDRTSERVKFDGKPWRSLGLWEKMQLTQAGPRAIVRTPDREVGVHKGPTLDVLALPIEEVVINAVVEKQVTRDWHRPRLVR